MTVTHQVAIPNTVLAPKSSSLRPGLYGPLTDFMLLGGGSLLLMSAIWLLLPDDMGPALRLTMILLANVINHPHFGHSYQIFYRNFRAKAFGAYSPALRARYVFAGLITPALLASYLVGTLAMGADRVLGFSINIMGFFVGWHYVKQGYGMLMLDAALKQRFFTAPEKKLFLVNAYLAWIFAWIYANQAINEEALWGLKAYTFAIPAPLLLASGIATALALAACTTALVRRHLSGASIPWNGVTAYLVSIYPWMLIKFAGGWMFLVVPACHSLQYLAVVWRYQLNHDKAEAIMDGKAHDDDAGSLVSAQRVRFASFITRGMVLGFAGFWVLPMLIDKVVPYDHSRFGEDAFLAIFWIFINVHHYFLDNVMWRRENADMKRYLFG